LTQIELNPQLTLNEISDLIKRKFNIDTSKSAIERKLKIMEITWKKSLPIPREWNTDQVILKRMEFIGLLGNIFPRQIYYVDETGFHMHIKRTGGRAIKGEPAILTLVPKGKRITVIACLSNAGITHIRIVESYGEKRGTNAEDFRNFLIDLFPKMNRNSLLISDNAKIHHAELLKNT